MLPIKKTVPVNRRLTSVKLEELGLLTPKPEEDFDAITSLATSLFGVPVALISIIDDENHRQFFKSQIGLSEPWAGKRCTPLTHSFCQYVREFGETLIVKDATKHELVRNNLAIPELNVMSYLGAPIYSTECDPIGALCIIDSKPRDWTKSDVALLTKLARCVTNEIRHKAANLSVEELYSDLHKKHADTMRYNALREWICSAFMAPNLTAQDRFQSLLKTGCDALCMEHGFITKVHCETVDVLYGHNLPDGAPLQDMRISGTLSSLLISGRSQHQFHKRSVTSKDRRRDLLGNTPEAFIGVPLISNGVVFGTLEMSSSHERSCDWTEEELSMVSVMSMVSGVYLSFIDKIQTLERSETALLNHLMERQSGSMVPAF